MTSNKGTLIYLGAFAAFIALVAIFGLQRQQHEEAEVLRLNNSRAEDCIFLKGQSYNCERIDLALLDPETSNKVTPFIETWKKTKAEAAAKVQAETNAYQKQQKALAAEWKRKAAEAEASFKAEGWWEQQPGIFLRWCDGKHPSCPGPRSNAYSDYTWRAMVWCKERACGDIYARLNILNGDTVVGWTNDTAYGSYGQKVVLNFGSHISGTGRIVEFKARG